MHRALKQIIELLCMHTWIANLKIDKIKEFTRLVHDLIYRVYQKSGPFEIGSVASATI